MDETLMQKFLFNQAPIVVILIFGLIWLYKILNGTLKEREAYFVGVIAKLYKDIEDKDEQIQRQNREMREVIDANTRAMIELQNTVRNTQKRT